MTDADGDDLRALVRDALREVLPEMLAGVVQARAGRARVEDVRVTDDADLAAFAARVLDLGDDVRAGRVTFRLVAGPAGRAATSATVAAENGTHRVDRGAVTERHVRAAETAGRRIVVGPRAVVTPLARDRARTAGVEIVRDPATNTDAGRH
ncbi:hypothetical protein [Kineosporia sp. R_H_3]|uniref:hypothetical protein n=1 Tax=Kineosporia sp. R_H_3 TaxID=1961848 RepID=UPI000B4AFD08|nr:hypothetical protein [Kineosporia sp. R_H_3]